MKEYLFVNPNNGHKYTYHPFKLNKTLTQERADEIMSQNSLAARLGMEIEEFLYRLSDNGYEIEYWTCPCCKNQLTSVVNPIIENWNIINGIAGNY